jgi:hypothetical protein
VNEREKHYLDRRSTGSSLINSHFWSRLWPVEIAE